MHTLYHTKRLILTLILTPIILLFILLVIATFGLYRLIICIILRLKFRDKFGGLITGTEAAFALEAIAKHPLNLITIVESDESDPGQFIEAIRNFFHSKCFSDPFKFPKLSSVRRKFLGYHFYLRDEVGIESIKEFHIDTDAEAIDKRCLQEVISSNADKPLPKNNEALWEILIPNKPILWTAKSKKREYVLWFRFHHTLTDGVSMVKFIIEHLSDGDSVENVFFKYVKNLKKQRWSFGDKVKFYWGLLMGPANMLLKAYQMSGKADGVLHSQNMSKRNHLVWSSESERRLVPMVRDIKNRIPHVAFSDVILTAISQSLHQFYQKQYHIPQSINVIISAACNIENAEAFQNTTFSFGLMAIPLFDGNSPILERLQKVHQQTDKLRESSEFLITTWFFSFLATFLPHPLLYWALHPADNLGTVCLSSIPGNRNKISIFNGRLANDVFFWLFGKEQGGCCISILTYDDRFQIALLINEVLVADRDEAQAISDGILEHIRLMREEIDLIPG